MIGQQPHCKESNPVLKSLTDFLKFYEIMARITAELFDRLGYGKHVWEGERKVMGNMYMVTVFV